MSVNKVILLGRVGQEPELKYTPSGSAVCSISLATSESWTDKTGQRQERTEWHRIQFWGKQAEIINQYINKGSQLFVEGSLQTRQWEAKDGSKRYTTEIIGRSFQFIGGQQSQAPRREFAPEQRQSAPQNSYAPVSEPVFEPFNGPVFTEDEIPF